MSERSSARAAREGDYDFFVRMFAELAVPDAVPAREQFEREIVRRSIVLEEGARSTAYAQFFALGTLGRVVHVVVDPAFRGAGRGEALMREIGTRLRAQGCERWVLHVKPDNVPALKLYERLGFARSGESCAVRLAWSDVAKLARAPDGSTARAIAADGSEDTALERTFALLPGVLAELRGREGRVLLVLEGGAGDDGAPVRKSRGVAVFDPAFPGAFPLRVRSPADATALIRAMRPYARPEHDSLVLMIEGQPELVSVLLRAGAVVHLRSVRMEGALPSQDE